MLTFAKLLLESFAYDFTETFFFPGKKAREIYDKNMIEPIFPYSVLTNTDSICVFFIFICKPESSLPDGKFRDVLFEVIKENEILHRFDTSHKFLERFLVKDECLKKKLGYYSTENIDHPSIVTIAVNPREYFEKFESENVNKKHKVLRKGAKGMEFENYSKRINSIKETETFGQTTQENQKQNRFSIKRNEMVLEEIEKSKCAQINDKRYYFNDGIVSLPFFHPYLHEIIQFKRDKKQKSDSFLQEEKHKLIQMEKFSLEKNTRISLYRSILQQKPTYYHLDLLKRSIENNQNINFSQTTRSYILNGFWQ